MAWLGGIGRKWKDHFKKLDNDTLRRLAGALEIKNRKGTREEVMERVCMKATTLLNAKEKTSTRSPGVHSHAG